MVRCKFTMVRSGIIDGVVAIIDDDTVMCSVTNDMENVVKHLHKKGLLKPEQKLVYRDTRGAWEVIHHDHGTFLSFDLHKCETLDEAVELAKSI